MAAPSSLTSDLDRVRLEALLGARRETFATTHAQLRRLAGARAARCRTAFHAVDREVGGRRADLPGRGARRAVTDVDGNEYVDVALATPAHAGHSPEATVDAVIERVSARGGITTMIHRGRDRRR